MNKQQLVEEVSKLAELSKVSTTAALDSLISVITSTLKKGEEISLVGFGTFKVSERSERTARNPQTGATIVIPAKKVPSFKAGKALRDAVDGKDGKK